MPSEYLWFSDHDINKVLGLKDPTAVVLFMGLAALQEDGGFCTPIHIMTQLRVDKELGLDAFEKLEKIGVIEWVEQGDLKGWRCKDIIHTDDPNFIPPVLDN